MDEMTEDSLATSLFDVERFQCNQMQRTTSTASTPILLNDPAGANYGIVHHHQSESSSLECLLKQNLRIDCIDSCLRQIQSQGGPLELSKLERLQSLDSRGSERHLYEETNHSYQSAVSMATGCNALSSSFGSGVFSANPSVAAPCFAKGPLIYEAHSTPLDWSSHLSEQAHGRHIRSSFQKSYDAVEYAQPHDAPALVPGSAKPRTRARRGQATDPHSIAERKRREKITNAMKDLQELIPNLNKADRIAFVEDVIEYVKFLQIQTKVFFMSRLGSNPGSALVAETAVQKQEEPDLASIHLLDSNLASVEEDVARLLEVDMSEALRLLQSKGLCLMPLSLAAVMPFHDTKQPLGLEDWTT